MATGKLDGSSLSTYDYVTWNVSQDDLEVTVNPMEGFPYPSLYSWTRIITASIILTLIMLAIVLGNILVVVAIAVDRRLKGVQHWFIGSLAVSDLLVGLFIMPFSLANEVMGYWAFGDVICQLWLSTDVLLCTASILNLCLISLDRYWTITRPIDYVRNRTRRRAALMISVVWTLSMVISLPPLVGWKRPQPMHMGFPLCQLSSELGYVLYSTIGSFYVPLLVMVLVYLKIYLAARARARRNIKSMAASSATTAVTTAPSASRVDEDRLQLPVVQVEFDSSDEMECEDNLMNNQSGGKRNEEPEEQRAMLLAATADEDPEKEQHDESAHPANQLAVEYHGVGGANRNRCSQSRADDVITADDANHLLLRLSSRRSVRSANAQRRAEFFGIKPLSSDQVMYQLDEATSFTSRLPRSSEISSQADAEGCKLLAPESPAPLCQSSLRFASTGRLAVPSSAPRRSMIVDEQERSKRKLARARERHATLVLRINMKDAITMLRTRVGRCSRTRANFGLERSCLSTKRSKRKLARARERRATLVLGIVMASFIGCWLPFFSIYPLSLLFDLDVPDGLFAVIFWLGYCNSALNPVIYTIFNRDFRAAFASILCRHRPTGKHEGLGKPRRTLQTS